MTTGESSLIVLTCVYCGKEYPNDTPAWGNQVLTEHIKVCDKHPMRELELKYSKVRKALSDMVGCDSEKELDAMEAIIRMAKGISEMDRANTINAIDAIRTTIPVNEHR